MIFSVQFTALSIAEMQPVPPARVPGQDDPATAPFWRAMEKGNMGEAAKAFVGETANRAWSEEMLKKLPEMLAKTGPSKVHVELTHHNFDNRLIYSEAITYSESGSTLVEMIFINVDNHWLGQNIQFHASNETLQHVADAAKREEAKRDEKGIK
ncbi:MAG TPA: hypothetical protein VH370_06690 [Humisphaera sp.]|nr:hypothetical protein [Humisphaera sp.]